MVVRKQWDHGSEFGDFLSQNGKEELCALLAARWAD